jgi:hypothetical protein
MVGLTLGLGAAGCSEGADSGSVTTGPAPAQAAGPVVDQIAAAVTALEELLGGPQEYVEINADTRMVSLVTFDASSSEAQAYRYLAGVITPASEPFGISGGTPLRAEWIAFDPDRIFESLRAELPDSSVVGFVILAGTGETATYEAVLQSRQGGQILVSLGAQGQVLSVQVL